MYVHHNGTMSCCNDALSDANLPQLGQMKILVVRHQKLTVCQNYLKIMQLYTINFINIITN